MYAGLIRLAVANHCGNISEANNLWKQFQNTSGLNCDEAVCKNLEFEYKIRRIVTLMDSFAFDEANEILESIEDSEKFGKSVLSRFHRRLGICLNEYGQVCAFQRSSAKREMAIKHFRDALQLFEKQEDKEYSWVYLIHVACDDPEKYRELWHEAHDYLQEAFGELTCPFHSHAVAAILKSVWVFHETETYRDWVTKISTTMEALPLDSRKKHPNGLIFQNLAEIACTEARMGYQRAAQVERAKRYFDLAIESLKYGSSLLQGPLMHACMVRKACFLKEFCPQEYQKQQKLESQRVNSLICSLRVYVKSVSEKEEYEKRLAGLEIHSHSDETEEAYAKRILSNIRFNYW